MQIVGFPMWRLNYCFFHSLSVVTLYATLGPDAIIHGVNESEVSHVITSADLLPKFKVISEVYFLLLMQ